MSIHCGSLGVGGPHGVLFYVERILFLFLKQRTFSSSSFASLNSFIAKKKNKKKKKKKKAKNKLRGEQRRPGCTDNVTPNSG